MTVFIKVGKNKESTSQLSGSIFYVDKSPQDLLLCHPFGAEGSVDLGVWLCIFTNEVNAGAL